MKIINITGREYNDTVLYISAVFMRLGKNVLIRDMTRKHELYSAVPHIGGITPNEGIIDYRGLGYTFGERNGRCAVYESDYNVLIRLYDADMDPENSDYTIYVSDELKSTADGINKQRCSASAGSFLIIRNYTGTVRNQFEELITKNRIKKTYALLWSTSDARNSVNSEYRDAIRFDGISLQYKECLLEIIAEIFNEIPLKEIRDAFKSAMKGGRYY